MEHIFKRVLAVKEEIGAFGGWNNLHPFSKKIGGKRFYKFPGL